MSSYLDYPFAIEPHRDPVTKTVAPILRPKVSIRFESDIKEDTIDTDSLVDSGADYCLFPAFYLRRVGVKLEDGVWNELDGIGGVRIPAYLHRITMHLDKYNHQFEALVNFSEKQTFPLLGRKGFFDHFEEVVLDYSKNEVRLRLFSPSKAKTLR